MRIHSLSIRNVRGIAQLDLSDLPRLLDGAKALALTAAEFLLSPELQADARKAFEISRGLG